MPPASPTRRATPISPEFVDAGGCNEGFLRDDAILVATIISDEDDEKDLDGGGSKGYPQLWKEAIVEAKGRLRPRRVREPTCGFYVGLRPKRRAFRLGFVDVADAGQKAGERPFYEVELRSHGAIVRRTSRRYVHISELAPSFAALEEKLDALPAGASSLLVDLRAIVGRNDEAFESALAPLRRELLRKFERSALIVRTTIGRLQLERYLLADGIKAGVFSDEDEAMAWFLDGA